MSEILVNTIKKADGTGSITVPAETGTVLTSASSIPANNLTGSFVQNSGPAFAAKLTVGQVLTHNTTALVAFDDDSNDGMFDSDNCYDTTTGRFTPTVAGYYMLGAHTNLSGTQANDLYFSLALRKNASNASRYFVEIIDAPYLPYYSLSVSGMYYLNGTTDYVQVLIYGYDYDIGANMSYSGSTGANYTGFYGHLVRT